LSNREIVRRLKHRAYLRKSKVIFYNPMWNFIGDHDFQTNMERINGTYYFGEDKHQNIDQLHWNLLDQVLVSQPIINTLSPEDIKIIIKYSNGNKNPLLADKRFFNSTNKSYLNPKYSDHLPIEFSIDTTKLK
jgi:hypothetical protein